MIGGLCKLLHIQEFFVELLAMTETGKFNLHIRTSGKADHTLGKVHNLHRLTHVEDVDFTAVAHTAGLKNKAASFGNGHEVTDYLRMGHRHRTATLNLVAETGNDRTVGTQHIAETRSDELSGMASLLLQLLRKRLHINLANTLGTAHHVCRVNSLVRRNHHKLLGTVFHGKIGNGARAEYVHLDGLGNVVLHHRHMLVGGRMENILGLELPEDILHARGIGDVGYDGLGIDVAPTVLKFQTDVVQRGLGLVH